MEDNLREKILSKLDDPMKLKDLIGNDPQFKNAFEIMQIRGNLILMREELAELYVKDERDEILKIMGMIYKTIELVKQL